MPEKAKVGKAFKKDAALVRDYLSGLSESEVQKLNCDLQGDG